MSDSRSSSESTQNNITIGDRPAVKDTLGFQPYVIAIAEFLTHPDTKPPLTISIEGAWGRGKSSFMKQLEAEILQKYKDSKAEQFKQIGRKLDLKRDFYAKPLALRILILLGFKTKFWFQKFFLQFKFKFQQKPQIVWFNAWRHDEAESLWAAFALSFLEQISTNHRISDILPNLVGSLKLFWHRLNWQEKPFKFIQTLAIASLIGSIIVAIPVVYSKVGLEGVRDWSEEIAGLLEESPEADSQQDPEPESTENPFITWLIFIGGIGGGVAGMGKLLATLRNLIGDPKMDFTQYLKSPDYDSQVAFVEKFHEDFSKIVEAYAGKDRKVYVFIDDLDRCELGKSADLLQALNLMISNDPNLIFILGMDREKVAAAIAYKQQDVIPYLDSIARNSQESEPENYQLMKKLDYGYAFLEKFVQLSFSVPKPSENTLERFLEQFSADKQQNTQDNSSTLSNGTNFKEQKIYPLIQKEPTAEDINKLVKMVAPFFDYNPRNLKQYLNALKLRTYITYYSIGVPFKETNSLSVEELGKFTAIIVKYPRILPHLEYNNELLGQLEAYARSQDEGKDKNDEKTITDEDKNWVDNNPKLKKLLCDIKVADNKEINSLAGNKGIKKLLEVSSEQELNPRYFKLRQLLEEGKWREADEETATVMLQVAHRQQQYYLGVDDIKKFPCEDLRMIDRLWVSYSEGKFGFSVQEEIYRSLGGTKEYNEKVWDEFCERVGWNDQDILELMIYSSRFKPEEAPKAYLPYEYNWLLSGDGRNEGGALFSRAKTCHL